MKRSKTFWVVWLVFFLAFALILAHPQKSQALPHIEVSDYLLTDLKQDSRGFVAFRDSTEWVVIHESNFKEQA